MEAKKIKHARKVCLTCDGDTQGKTEHVILGFLPAGMFKSSKSNNWIRGTVCTKCGDLHTQPITEKEYRLAEKRFLRALVDTNNMSEEEAKDILGLN